MRSLRPPTAATCLMIFMFLLVSWNVIAQDTKERGQEPAPSVQGASPDSGASRAERHWYQDFNALSAIGAIGAVVISVLALVESRRQSSEQRKREKREELRSTVEKLVVLREEYNNRYAKTVDAQERQNLAIHSNTKRSIYLQAAEMLAKDLPQDVSSIEYYVIGQENELESDFQQARDYYRLAVEASAKSSMKSSIMNKSLAWRSLAGSYFWLEPYRDLSEGRKCYEEAIKLVQGENDPYSVYIKGFAHRDWASREASAGDFDEAANKLQLAYDAIRNLPDWYTLKAEELRHIADFWRWIANHYWNTQRNEQGLEKGRGFIKRAVEVIARLTDDNSNDIRGQIYQDWGYQEIRNGSREEGVRLLRQADEYYSKLPAPYPSRDIRVRVFQQVVSQLAQEMGIPDVEIISNVGREQPI